MALKTAVKKNEMKELLTEKVIILFFFVTEARENNLRLYF
jgi:hypothetical protein